MSTQTKIGDWYFSVYHGKHGFIAFASVNEDAGPQNFEGCEAIFALGETPDDAMHKLCTQMREQGFIGDLH